MRHLLFLAFSAVLTPAFLGWPQAYAAELRCTVRSVNDATVTLACDGGVTPRTGDEVTLGFEVPGVGFVALDGKWKVGLIGPGGEAQATPVTASHGQPQVDYIALVETQAGTAVPPGARRQQPNVTGPGGVATTPSTRAGPDDLPPVAYQARLGVRSAPETGDASHGVEIESVTPGRAAALAGVQPGDVILAIDGTPTPSGSILVGEVQRRRPGQLVRLRILRFPEVLDLDAELQAPSVEDPAVQEAIGRAYLNGVGVSADRNKAELWLRRAAAAGNPQAAALLGQLGFPGAWPQPVADPTWKTSASSRQTHGVFLVGTEKGNRSVLFRVDPAVRQVLTAAGAPVLELPADVRFPPGQAPEPTVVSEALKGRGWMLYMRLKLKWATLGFGKDRITVECYDPSGHLAWAEDASNVMADSRDHSTEILINKIRKKLHSRFGQACLRP